MNTIKTTTTITNSLFILFYTFNSKFLDLNNDDPVICLSIFFIHVHNLYKIPIYILDSIQIPICIKKILNIRSQEKHVRY